MIDNTQIKCQHHYHIAQGYPCWTESCAQIDFYCINNIGVSEAKLCLNLIKIKQEQTDLN